MRKLDEWICKAQYGFRKDKSTADAIHLIRRIAEHGQQTSNKLHMVLLDWEKAFDRVNPEALLVALRRIGTPQIYIDAIASMGASSSQSIVGIKGNWPTLFATGNPRGLVTNSPIP